MGIAISDPLSITAQGVAVIERGETIKKDIDTLRKIIEKYGGVGEIVVGLPISMSGEKSLSAKKVLAFVEELKRELCMPILTFDERFTTIIAEKVLIKAGLRREKRKRIIDKSAAIYMLQEYLNSKTK